MPARDPNKPNSSLRHVPSTEPHPFDFAGHELRRFNMDLPGNHLMDLTLDRDGHAFIEGSCGYAGGLSRIDIETGSARA